MPEWRYILKRTVAHGHAARIALANLIKNRIRAMRRTIELPVMKIETNPGHEFYIGLAVNDESCGNESPPDYVIDLFVQIGQPLSARDFDTWPTPPDEVDGFLHGSFKWDSMTSSLQFEASPAITLPTSLTDAEEIEAAQNPEIYDRLHWWCSSKEFGTVAQVAEVADALGLNELEGSVWAVLKKMSLLGHLDVFQDQDRDWVWRIAPLTVVEAASNSTAFLAGALSGRLRKQLVAKLAAEIGSTNGGPSRVIIPPNRIADLDSTIGFNARRAGNASDHWANLLPGIKDYQATLVPDPAIANEPHQYSFERYSGGAFVQLNGQGFRSGFYRVQRSGQQSPPKLVFRTADSRWLNGDFATLRFLSLTDGQQAKARHYPDGTLVVPMTQRWPSLYERALVLASGQLPSTQSVGDGTGRLLAYRTIPKNVAQTLGSKLNVTLTS